MNKRWKIEQVKLIEQTTKQWLSVINKWMPEEERKAFLAMQSAKGYAKNQAHQWKDFILNEPPFEILTQEEYEQEYPKEKLSEEEAFLMS